MSTTLPTQRHDPDPPDGIEAAAPDRTSHLAPRLPHQRAALTALDGGTQRATEQPSSGAVALLPVVTVGVDMVLVALALVSGSIAHLFFQDTATYVPSISVAAPALAATWIASLALAGSYDRHAFGWGPAEFSRLVSGCLAAAGLVGVGAFLTGLDLSRTWFATTFVVGIPLLLFGRVALRFWTKRLRMRGLLQQRVLVVGDAAHIASISSVLEREAWLGYRMIGSLATSLEGSSDPRGTHGVDTAQDVARHALENEADVIVFAGGSVSSPQAMRDIAWELEGTPVQVVVAPSLSDVSAQRVRMRPVGGVPLIHLEQPRAARAARRAKRLFDIAGSSLILLLLSPLVAYAATRIWLYDRGPILFRQERIGRDGQSFGCFKFRTMVVDAEARLAEVHAALGSDSDTMFYKLTDDPRITGPGKWMRRFSVDEVPQLLNVLKGDMSLVGPRPQVQHEVALYDRMTSRRLHVRPGMTGLWQVSGRSDLPVEEAVRLDLYYVDNWSMMADIAILLRTFSAVVSSRGAY